MSLMDKITGFLTAVGIFIGIPALLIYVGYRRVSQEKWITGVILLLAGFALAWVSYQFMYNVGPHARH